MHSSETMNEWSPERLRSGSKDKAKTTVRWRFFGSKRTPSVRSVQKEEACTDSKNLKQLRQEGAGDSVDSKRPQKLHVFDIGARPGQNHHPEESAGGDRRIKHSESPEALVCQQETACYGQQLNNQSSEDFADVVMPNMVLQTEGDHPLPELKRTSLWGRLRGPPAPFDQQLLTIAIMFPGVHGRPVSKQGGLSDAMNDELLGLLHGVIGGSIAWIPPGAAFIRFLYTIKKMPPDQNLQEYRMMSAVAALGPSIGSELRASISWWLLLNAVSLMSLIRYAQACSPRFHKSQWLLGILVAGGIGLDCLLCYLSSPSQGVDSGLFGQLLGPSFWMVLVVLDFIAKRKAWLRDRLQHIVETLV